jgi:dGTPase
VIDGRSPYQRDRDRVLYTDSFRRLAGITQVTSPNESQTFRNRLTHTLEVAQLARRMAEHLLRTDPSLAEALDPDVCEAAALAHDLGHPPFGHNGELTLDRLARGDHPATKELDSDTEGYEGNAQSLRILTTLASRSLEHVGLNLTAASLRASIKYPWVRAAAGKEFAKFGCYLADRDALDRLYKGLPEKSQTLEAQIMDWADDVAYSTHDVYDFALAGVIPLGQAAREGFLGDPDFIRTLVSRGISSELLESGAIQPLELLPIRNLAKSSRSSSQFAIGLKQWVSWCISRFAMTDIAVESENGKPMLKKRGTIEDEVQVLKAVTYHYAIGAPSLASRQLGEQTILTQLYLALYHDARGRQRLFSDEARGRIEREGTAVRVILDTISGMTDSQAQSMYRRITGHDLGSILDASPSSTT